MQHWDQAGKENSANIYSSVISHPDVSFSMILPPQILRGEDSFANRYRLVLDYQLKRYTVSLWYFSPALVMGWGQSLWCRASG